MTVIQLTQELQKLVRGMNGVSVHVQNDVAALQTDIRCRRSDLDIRHDHSALSRQTGNPYSPNFHCPEHRLGPDDFGFRLRLRFCDRFTCFASVDCQRIGLLKFVRRSLLCLLGFMLSMRVSLLSSLAGFGCFVLSVLGLLLLLGKSPLSCFLGFMLSMGVNRTLSLLSGAAFLRSPSLQIGNSESPQCDSKPEG